MKKYLSIIEVSLSIAIMALIVIAGFRTACNLLFNQENVFSGVPTVASILLELLVWLIGILIMKVIHIIIKKKLQASGTVAYSTRFFKFLIRHWIISALVLLAILVIVTIISIPALESKILYNGSYNSGSEYYVEQRKQFEKIEIEKNDTSYIGWIHRSGSCKTVVYFGGNAQNSSDTMCNYNEDNYWETFKDYNFIMIDYPGYGRTQGTPSKDGIFAMADAVLKYVESDDSLNEQIIVMGFSLGTGVATYAASENDIDGLILLAPYDEMKNVYNSMINIFHGPISNRIKNNYDSKSYARGVSSSVLVVASEDDEIIPYELSVNLYNQFSTEAELITIKDALHNDIGINLKTRKAIEVFLNSQCDE